MNRIDAARPVFLHCLETSATRSENEMEVKTVGRWHNACPDSEDSQSRKLTWPAELLVVRLPTPRHRHISVKSLGCFSRSDAISSLRRTPCLSTFNSNK